MKSKIYLVALRLCLVFSFLAATTTFSNAQTCSSPPNCIQNPDFVGSLGDLNASGQTVNDWFVAQGTPNIQTGGAGGTNRVGMWSFNGHGEGIYACYNFQQNRTYQICLWVQNTTAENRGNLEIMAANGLTQNFSSATRPTPPTSELIDDSHVHSPTLTQLVINYTPTANFSQLWIFPDNSVPAADYRIKVSRVNIIERPLGVGYSVPCGEDLVLPASTQTCATTSWLAPDGSSLGAGTVVIENIGPSKAGQYTQIVSVGDCSISLPIPVTVGECSCEEFEASFEVSGVDQPIRFTETSTGPGKSVAWFWEFGDGNTSNDPNPTHNYAQAGVYEVCLTVTRQVGDQTCCKRICMEIEVGEPIEEKTSGTKGKEPVETTNNSTGFNYNTMEMPRAIAFNNTTTANIFAEYSWSFGDGITSGRENPVHVYAEEGSYNVCLTTHNKIYDANSHLVEQSSKEYCKKINVGSTAYDINAAEIHVMPNPSKNKAYVTVENMPSPQVILRNVAGVEVAKGSVANPNQYIINLEGLSNGIYIVEVKSTYGSKTIKLIKE